MTGRLFGPILVVASATLAAGCAPSIRSERDENIPVPQGATWAWSGDGAAAARDTGPRGHYIPERYQSGAFDAIAQQRFRRAIDEAMRGRGFHRAEDSAHADFLLSLSFDGTEAYRRPAVASTVGFGNFGGYYGRFYRPWGFYRPSSFYQPWGWAPWGWGFGFAAYPAYGYGPAYYPYGARAYADGWLAVTLRLRSDGEVAWVGRYRTEAHRVQEMSQEKVQEAVNKLFATLH